tara:strand:+ start:646 stop:2112 length:1467 start_codon:yes stop_codon:yes gene_type:complete
MVKPSNKLKKLAAEKILSDLRSDGAKEKTTVIKGSKINKDSLTKRVRNNERKITSIKSIIKIRESDLAPNLQSLEEDNSLSSISGGLSSILKTISGIGKSLNTKTKSDKKTKEKKRVRMNRLKKEKREEQLESKKEEKDSPEEEKKEKKSLGGNFLEGIKRFFKNILLGTALLTLLNWLRKPENMARLQSTLDFLTNHAGPIFKGLIAIAAIGIGAKLYKIIRGTIKFARAGLKALGLLKPAVTVGKGGSIGSKLSRINPFRKSNVSTSGGFKTGPLSGVRKNLSKINPFKQSAKVTQSTSKAITSNVTKNVTKNVGKTVVKKSVAKGAGKTILKKLPFVGLALGLGFAIDRARKGDFVGATMELGSGAASMIPGLGTGASLLIDGALIAKDSGAFGQNKGDMIKGGEIIGDIPKAQINKTPSDIGESISKTSSKKTTIKVIPIETNDENSAGSSSESSNTEIPSAPSTSGVENDYTSSVYGLLGGVA